MSKKKPIRNRKREKEVKGISKDEMVGVTIEVDNSKQKKLRALREITDIEVLLHRHVFAGDYSYTELEERIGQKIYVEDTESKNYRRDLYLKTGYVWFNGCRVRIFWSSKYRRAPNCIIEISSPPQTHLIELNRVLPDLKLLSIEYTVDFYCSSSSAVRDLFKVLVRNIYVPRARQPNCHRGHSQVKRQSFSLNRTCHFLRLKIYERGSGKSIGHDGWEISLLDRVRIELKADKRVLSKNGLVTLEDLIRNCNFGRIFIGVLNFKTFKGSSLLPTENSGYRTVQGLESFQEELRLARRRNRPKNPYQYMKDDPVLYMLRKQVIRSIRKFDRDWRKDFRQLFKRSSS